MAGNRIQYEVGFTADTSQLQKKLESVMQTLSQMGARSKRTSLTQELQEGIQAATQLGGALKSAFNTDTGKLDLSKFQQNLNASGKTIKQYGQDLAKLGPQGQQAFLQMASAISQCEVPLKRSNKLLDDMWVSMKNTMKWQISSSVLNAFTGALSTAYNYSKDLNKSLNDIKIVSGQSTAQMRDFAKEANAAAKELSTTTTAYTEGSLIYFQQGLSTEEVKERTDITIKMANAVGESTEKISDQLTAVWNNFADGTQTLEHYADAMVKLGAYTASSSDEIAQGTEKFAAVAKMIGLDFDNAAAALATVTAQTRQSADVVGTAFKTIFARMEGLKLGETLDDGTDLNQYSQALATVGVNIKDQNGQLKDMTTLIDEIGNKWKTISKDQQVALAQTVAGVRQYTQFAALFENFDYYQELVGVAKDSTGELTKQAQIYEESWKASSKRLQASAESLYSSLINEDFFISFNDNLASLLSGLSDVMEGMGGLKGVIISLGSVFTTVYREKIAQSMRDWVENIKTNLGITQAKNISFLRSMNQSMVDYSQNNTYLDNSTKIQFKNLGEINNLTLKLSELNNSLTEEQKLQIQNQIEFLKNLSAIAVKTQQIVDDETKRANQSYQEGSEHYYDTRQEKAKAEGKSTKRLNDNVFTSKELGLENNNFYNNLYNNGILKTQQAQTKKAGSITSNEGKQDIALMRKIKGAVDEVSIKWQEVAESNEDATEKAKQYQTLLKGFKGYTKELGVEDLVDDSEDYEKIGKELTQLSKDAANAGDTFQNSFINNYTDGSDEAKNAINGFSDGMEAAGSQAMVVNGQLGTLENGVEALGQGMEEGAKKTGDWADNLANGMSALAGLLSFGQSISNLGKLISEGGLKGFDGFLQVLGALIPMITGVTAVTRTLITTESKAIAMQKLKAYATKEGIVLQNASVIGMGTEIVAQKGVAAGWYQVAKAQIVASLSNPVGWITLAVAGLAALTVALIGAHKSNEDYIKDAKEAEKAYDEEHQKLTELNDELKTTQDRINELKNQGTLSFVEQFELKKLQNQNDLLERQIKLQKEKDILAAKDALETDVSSYKKVQLTANKIEHGEKDYFENYYTDEYEGEQGFILNKNATFEDLQDAYLLEKENIADLRAEAENSDDDYYNPEEYLKRLDDRELALEKKMNEFIATHPGIYDTEENRENLLNMEESYLKFLSVEGIDKTDKSLEELRKNILKFRDAIYSNGEQWEIYIKPILDREEFSGVKEKIYDALLKGEEIPDNILSQDLKDALFAAGYTLEEFQAESEAVINQAKDNLKGIFGWTEEEGWETAGAEVEKYNEVLNQLDPSVLERLATIDPSDLTKKLEGQEITVENLTNAINELGIKAGSLDDVYLKLGSLFGIKNEKDARMKSQSIFRDLGLNVDAQQKLAPYFNIDNINSDLNRAINETMKNSSSLSSFNGSITQISRELGDVRKQVYEEQKEPIIQKEISRAATEAMYNDAKDMAANISDVLTTITKDGYEKTTAAQKAILKGLEQTYPELAQIVDKSSKEYQEKLYEIQETQEKATLKYSRELMNRARPSVDVKLNIDDAEKQIEEFYKRYDEFNVAIKIDIDSDIEHINTMMNSVADSIGLIGEKGKVAADDIVALAQAFPGITENATIANNGMIQLNEESTKIAIENARKTVEAEKEAVIDKLNNYVAYYTAIAEAEAEKAKEYQKAKLSETNADATVGQVKEKIAGIIQDNINSKAEAANELELQGEIDFNKDLATLGQEQQDAVQSEGTNEVKIAEQTSQKKLALQSRAVKQMISNLSNLQKAEEAASKGLDPTKYLQSVRSSYNSKDLVNFKFSGLEDLQKATEVNTATSSSEYQALLKLFKDLPDGETLLNNPGLISKYNEMMDSLSATSMANSSAAARQASIYAAQILAIQAKNPTATKTGSSGSSKSESAKEAKEAKEYLDMIDIFSDVNAALEKYAKLLERANDELDDADSSNKADIYRKMASYNKEQIAQAQEGLAIAQGDINNVTKQIKDKIGIDVVFDPETGDVLNMLDVQGRLNVAAATEKNTLDERKAKLDSNKENLDKMKENKDAGYESRLKIYQDDFEKYEQDKDAYENFYDNIQNLLDGSVDNWKDYKDKIYEYTRTYNENMANILLAEIEYQDEISDEKKNWNDFVKSYFEEFDDILHYGPYIAQKSGDNAALEIENINRYRKDLEEITSNEFMTESAKQAAMANLRSKIRDSIQNFYSEISNIQDTILNTLEEVQNRFDEITEDIQRRNSRISAYQEILTLQGYDSVRSKEGRALYAQAANTRLTNLRSEYDVEQQNSAMLLSQKQAIEDKLANLVINTDADKFIQSSLKKQLKEIEDSYQDSQDRMVEITQEELTLIKEMYNSTLDQQLYDYEQELTGGLGFDQLQTNIDYNFEAEERYLDMVNEEYAVKEYGRQLDKAINSAQNKYAAEQYENLRDEMEQRRKNGKLSQYDLDIMNAKLEVTKAQMALEEAQNAKSTVRLVRNNAGNWDYQFTADQNKIDEAQANYDKAVNDSYNLAKNYYKTNMQNIIALRQQTYSQIEQIVKDETLTEAQKEEAIKKVREQALDKYKYIMSEMKIAQSDMSEFGKATTEDYHNVFKGVTEGLDLSYKSFQESFDKNTETMKQTFYQYGMQIDKTSREAGMDINSIQKNIENLTTATDIWKSTTKTALDEIYSQKGHIDEMTESLAKYNEQMAEAGGVELANRTTTYEPTNDKMARIQEANNVEAAVYWNNERNKYIQDNNLDTRMFTEQEIRQAYEDKDIDLLELAIAEYKKENPDDDKIYNYLYRRNNKIQLLGKYKNEQMIITKEQLGKYILEKSFATGGYTGEFSGARLAFLHEKELVLNKTDTQNILSAVAAVRELAPALLEKIGQSLNGQILAGRSLMESRMSVYKPSFSAEAQPLEQNVIIQADFPGVSAAVEIEAALNNLINDATQYASVVRG